MQSKREMEMAGTKLVAAKIEHIDTKYITKVDAKTPYGGK